MHRAKHMRDSKCRLLDHMRPELKAPSRLTEICIYVINDLASEDGRIEMLFKCRHPPIPRMNGIDLKVSYYTSTE